MKSTAVAERRLTPAISLAPQLEIVQEIVVKDLLVLDWAENISQDDVLGL
jgi:hypothetical protein